MDREHRRRRVDFQIGPLRRHFCPQGHRLRARLVDLCGIQALSHSGVSTPQGGRERPPETRLKPPAHPRQNQLPHPHRRHQGHPHPAVHHQSAGHRRLCQRGGPAQRRPLWPDRQTMARCPSRSRRKHPRPRPAGATRRPHQSRKPQFRNHPPRATTVRTPRHPQRHRHHPQRTRSIVHGVTL